MPWRAPLAPCPQDRIVKAAMLGHAMFSLSRSTPFSYFPGTRQRNSSLAPTPQTVRIDQHDRQRHWGNYGQFVRRRTVLKLPLLLAAGPTADAGAPRAPQSKAGGRPTEPTAGIKRKVGSSAPTTSPQTPSTSSRCFKPTPRPSAHRYRARLGAVARAQHGAGLPARSAVGPRQPRLPTTSRAICHHCGAPPHQTTLRLVRLMLGSVPQAGTATRTEAWGPQLRLGAKPRR